MMFRVRSVAHAAIAALAYISVSPLPAAAITYSTGQSDVPAGVLLTRIKLGDGPVVPQASNSAAGRDLILIMRGFAPVGKVLVGFTSVERHPFYTLPSDCKGECLTRWKPALITGSAKAVGDWSIAARDDGSRQWVFRGKPLYTFIKEKEFKGNYHYYYARDAPGRVQQALGAGVDGAVVAEADPNDQMKLPVGMNVVESLEGSAMILAGGQNGTTIYGFAGNAAAERKLAKRFRPYPASMTDQPIGDFKIRTLDDGTRQWIFRGQPLYVYTGDQEAGTLNGANVVPGIAPAVVFQFFMPREVAIKPDERSGGLFIEAKTGRLLYVRDRLEGAGPQHILKGPEKLNPYAGMEIGISGCDRACEKEWKPFLAAKDAQPQGHWSLYDRPDGSKQWAYRTYAIYLHPSDPPDTVYGSEEVDVAFDDGSGKQVPEEHGTALIFKAVSP